MAGIDMQAIKDAIARRQGGGASPVLSTQGAPSGQTPTGGPSTPTVQPPTTPTPQATTPGTMAPQGQPRPTQPTQARPQMKQVGNFDEETRSLAKALIAKLMGTL